MKAFVLKLKRLGSRVIAPDWLEARGLTRRGKVIACLAILFIAVGVRLLHWQNNRLTIDKNMPRLSARYKDEAQLLLDGGVTSFIRGNTPEPDTGLLIHTPGYPLLMAFIYKVSGHSDTALRFFHILCDAGVALMVFFIAAELLPAGVAIIAGLLVGLSPQLSFNSLLLLADSLSGLPILLAIYLIVRARKRPRLVTIIAAGAAVGISCWIRANALLLAPFLGLLILLLFERSKRWRYAGAMVGAAFLVISPITIRNAIVFRSFIPLSLGAGQNLVAGIGDYDPERRFGLEAYDDDASRQEAQLYNRPDYAYDLYRPDGVERERARLARASAVIRSNKLWFLGVVLRRAASMLTYEQVSIVSVEPTVTNPIEITDTTEPAWSGSPGGLLMNSKAAPTPGTRLSLTAGGDALQINGDDSEQGIQLATAPITIQRSTDYVIRLPVKIEQGRMVIKVERVDNGKTLASATIPDSLEQAALAKDSMSPLQLPFVSGSADQIRVVVANAGPRPLMKVGNIEAFRLGPASYLWTRYPRMLVKSAQKFFSTGWMLPLTLLGIMLLALARRGRVLAIMLAVPAYYLCVHSPIHVEPRYVLAMHYFFLTLVAVALYWMGIRVGQLVKMVKASARRG